MLLSPPFRRILPAGRNTTGGEWRGHGKYFQPTLITISSRRFLVCLLPPHVIHLRSCREDWRKNDDRTTGMGRDETVRRRPTTPHPTPLRYFLLSPFAAATRCGGCEENVESRRSDRPRSGGDKGELSFSLHLPSVGSLSTLLSHLTASFLSSHSPRRGGGSRKERSERRVNAEPRGEGWRQGEDS